MRQWLRFQLAGLLASAQMASAGAQAETAPPPPAAPQSLAPQKILSVVTADWNKDGGFDRAVLFEGEQDAGLLIYLSDPSSINLANPGMNLTVFVPDAAWSGHMWGSTPELKPGPKESLQLKSQNAAIGRDKWTQTLTLVYRPGGFVVAGFTYQSYDGLDPKNTHSCDINLLTGKGVVGKKAVKIAPVTIKISDWRDDKVPKPCQFD